MTTEIDRYFIDIVERVSKDLGDVLDVSTVRWVRDPGLHAVKDSTFALYVDGKSSRDDLVVLVSPPLFPNAVADDIDRAAAVAGLLSEKTAAHVLRPRAAGRWGEQSYGAFQRLEPKSSGRVYGYAQKISFAPRIGAWLAEVARETRRSYREDDAYTEHFVDPLKVIRDDPDISQEVREAAGIYLDYVTETRRDLFTVVEHTDLWSGNVFFKRMARLGRGALMGDFFVIDWRGAKTDGYPGTDILRYCQSVFVRGGARPAAVLADYASKVGLDPFEMGLYSTLSLGQLGQNLDQFPKDRFCALVEAKCDYLKVNMFGGRTVRQLAGQAKQSEPGAKVRSEV